MNAPTPDPMLRMTPQKASQRMVAADGSKRVPLDRLRAAAATGRAPRAAAELAKHDRAMAEIAELSAPEVTAAIERARDVIGEQSDIEFPRAVAHAALSAAFDDPDLAPRISTWRHTGCEHSRILNPREHFRGEPAEYEQACSPCLRDRLLSWLLGGAA